MAKLSQKELLTYTNLYNEGIGSILRGALGKTAQAAGGLAGVAGTHLLPKTKAFKDSITGSFKAGASAEAQRQEKGGVLGITGDMFKSKLSRLKKALEDQGYIYKDHSGNLNKQVSVEVGALMYKDGKPMERPTKPDAPKLEPVVAKWNPSKGTYSVSRMGRKTYTHIDKDQADPEWWHPAYGGLGGTEKRKPAPGKSATV